MESINLLKENEPFIPMISTKERIEEAFKQHKLVYTNNLRGVGKTYALIEFAKEHNYNVLLVSRSKSAIDTYKKELDYDKIYRLNLDKPDEYRGIGNCVIDEELYIIPDWLEPLVVTGFTCKIKPIEDFKLFNTKIVRALNSEIELLLSKIEAMNKNNKDSDYKMLINNLEKTIFVRDNVIKSWRIKL